MNLNCALPANYPTPPSTSCSLFQIAPSSNTAIAVTGDSGFYLTPKVSCANINSSALTIVFDTVRSALPRSSTPCNLLVSQLSTTPGPIMPNFHHNLMDIGSLWNHDCRVLFKETAFTVFAKDNPILLRGQREPTGSKL